MQIIQVGIYPVAVPRAYATQIAREGGGAQEIVDKSLFAFIEAETDTGLTGWGEISDIELPEWSVIETLNEELQPFLVGRDPYDLQAIHSDYRSQFAELPDQSVRRMTLTAIDMLCHDLQAQAAKVPLYKLLGGAHRQRIPISWVAYIREELSLLKDEIREKCAQGFSAFKLKVGVDIDLDEERLAVLREEAGPTASIKIDANGGWSCEEAVEHIRRLAKYHLAGVETPVAGRIAADLAAVRREVDVPILEHVNTPEDALDYVRHESLDCFNISTTGCGGIRPARQIADIAEAARVGILLGSTVEMGPGTLAQIHLGASILGLSLPSDLIGPGMYTQDVLVHPLRYEAGQLIVPTSPGLGGEIDRTQLRALKSE